MISIKDIKLKSFQWLTIRDFEEARKEAGTDADFKASIEEFLHLLP